MTMPQQIREINTKRASRSKLDAAIPAAIKAFLATNPTATVKVISDHLTNLGMKASDSYIYNIKRGTAGKIHRPTIRSTVPFRDTKRRARNSRKHDDAQLTGIPAAVSLVRACNGDFEQVRKTIDLVQRVAEAKWA